MVIAPLTSSRVAGLVVPMPRLPLLSMVARVCKTLEVSAVENTKSPPLTFPKRLNEAIRAVSKGVLPLRKENDDARGVAMLPSISEVSLIDASVTAAP